MATREKKPTAAIKEPIDMTIFGPYRSTAFPAKGEAIPMPKNRKVNPAMMVDRSHPNSACRGLTNKLKAKYMAPENIKQLRKVMMTIHHP